MSTIRATCGRVAERGHRRSAGKRQCHTRRLGEQPHLIGNAIQGTGNDINNVVTGQRAEQCLDGGAGDDTVDGGRVTTPARGSGNDVRGARAMQRLPAGGWDNERWNGANGLDVLLLTGGQSPV